MQLIDVCLLDVESLRYVFLWNESQVNHSSTVIRRNKTPPTGAGIRPFFERSYLPVRKIFLLYVTVYSFKSQFQALLSMILNIISQPVVSISWRVFTVVFSV